MEDKEFIAEYKSHVDNIHASDDLRRAVMDLKPQKRPRAITPFKATIGTVAAAIMIFAAVHEYRFETDTSGVISETVVSTELPEAQFEIIEKKTPTEAPKSVLAQKSEKVENTATVRVTAAPIVVETPAATADIASQPETASHTIENITPQGRGRTGGENITTSIEMWSLAEYYDYLGVNVSGKVIGKYTGNSTIEFEVGSDGEPVDDTAVLTFVTPNGAILRITLSKRWLFDPSLSGSIIPAGNGFNAYKLSNGVYYNVYAQNLTEVEINAIISGL